MSTGRRIEQGKHQPNKGKARPWRTRQDPLGEVWESELVPMLELEPQLRPITLFEYLQEKYPDQYDQSKLRTLQKRVREWKAAFGPPKEVMFEQQHLPGVMGLSDFTHFKQASITIEGKPFDHLLYHYRLAYSGWQYVHIVQGGESFVALAEGLQNALLKCGGSPKIHRTDSLSAAYRNINSHPDEDLTQKYEQLCNHYQMQPTRNNRGLAHENGGIESSHGYFKRRLHQALLVRGSFNFGSIEDYQQFINAVIEKLNRRCALKFLEESQHLQPLPLHQTADYEMLSVRVTCHSTITVRCVLYTVPSQLIGQRLTIHLYQNRLVGFLGNQRVMELSRVYPSQKGDKRRAHCVDYRHVIHSLRRKPRAFLQSRWREELLPNDQYRRIWRQLQEQFKPDEASRLMVESLYIAAVQDKEYVIGLWLEGQLRDKTLNLKSLKQKFASIPVAHLEVSTVNQHPLERSKTKRDSLQLNRLSMAPKNYLKKAVPLCQDLMNPLEPYDQLLQYDQSQHCRANLTHPIEVTATALYAATMAGA